jgi:ATP/maltotriose-dependent transcriptional regulator MalT
VLAELERRQLFTDRVDDDSYRYHTVLLSYLEARLVETVGPTAAREEHQRAAILLEREGLTGGRRGCVRQGGGLAGGGPDTRPS